LSASRHGRRNGAVVGALAVALSFGACDKPPDTAQPAAETRQESKPRSEPAKNSPGPKKQNTPEDKSFTISAGSVTVRRVGFDTLRIVRVTAKSPWRRHIEDNFEDSVGVEFLRPGRLVDFTAALENGRLKAESCEDISRLSTRPAIGDAGTVALQRIGDEDLHVSIVESRPGWRPRITDNNSEDIEVLFVSGKGRIEFDAQLDDGRLEGTICKTV
jgi:hypothetical protein